MVERTAEKGDDGSSGADNEGAARSADLKSGPGHTVLLALVLTVPVTKVAYTVGAVARLVTCSSAWNPRTGPTS
ncbi:hypothetical protein K388_07448 [Streptomyces sp. KhCrAH-43]|nr:hypothetical protein K388_07448 [Streptomyces sp. KhCrAH-43]